MRTADYSEQDRKRLGDAVAEARRAAGYRWRPAFIRDTGLGKRSLEAVERGEAGVGISVLEDVGRALGRFLHGWTKDTPRQILDREDPPLLRPRNEPPPEGVTSPGKPSVHSPEFWSDLRANVDDETYQRLWQLYLDRNRLSEQVSAQSATEGERHETPS